MPRCPDCNKFVSVEMGDPEANLEVSDQEDGSALITGNVHIFTQCGECSTNLSESNLDVEFKIEIQHEEDMTDEGGCEGANFDIESEEVVATDRFEGKGRGAKHFYGAEINVTVKC